MKFHCQMRRTVKHFFIFLLFLFAACQKKDNNPEKEYPVFPGCEKYQSAQMRKWCFESSLTDTLQKIISNSDKLNRFSELDIPDTLYLMISIDSTGHFRLDSLYLVQHSETKNFMAQSAQSWVENLPAVSLPSGSIRPKYEIPVILK